MSVRARLTLSLSPLELGRERGPTRSGGRVRGLVLIFALALSACGQAASSGLDTTLTLWALLYLLSVLHLALGSRTLGRDLARKD